MKWFQGCIYLRLHFLKDSVHSKEHLKHWYPESQVCSFKSRCFEEGHSSLFLSAFIVTRVVLKVSTACFEKISSFLKLGKRWESCSFWRQMSQKGFVFCLTLQEPCCAYLRPRGRSLHSFHAAELLKSFSGHISILDFIENIRSVSRVSSF